MNSFAHSSVAVARAVLLAGCMLAGTVSAAELQLLDVVKRDSHVFVTADVRVDANPEAVFQALLDYDNFSMWSEKYRFAGYIEPAPDGRPRVETSIEGCLLLYCRAVTRVMTLDSEPSDFIRATADPELSDVLFGVEEWRLEPLSTGTLVRYTHEVEFDFWVPPVVGVWAIKRSLNKNSLEAANRIENLARQEPAANGAADGDST